MATTALVIKADIEADIKAITPTKEGSLKFRLFSDDAAPAEEDTSSTGIERSFGVGFSGGQVTSEETFDGFHDPSEEEVREELTITVAYPSTNDHRALDDRMRSDLYDLKHRLNDPANWATDVLKQRVVAWQSAVFDKDLSAYLVRLTVFVRFLEAT